MATAFSGGAVTTRFGLAAIVLLLSAVCGCGAGDYPRKSLLECLLAPDDTRFAPQFSESAFEKISPGMPEGDVIGLLGPPLGTTAYRGQLLLGGTGIFENDEVTPPRGGPPVGPLRRLLHYSKPGEKYESFHVRSIEISESGLVEEKSAWFHVD